MTEEIKQRIETIKSGKVPDGYIKNNVGIFPNDWVTDKTLGDIGVFGKGKGIPGNMLGTGDIPCVGYGDIYMKYNNFHFEKALSFVDEATAKESTPIKKGTLLFTGTGETAEEIGKCICYNGDETIYAGGDIITFYSKNVNPIFIAYQQYQNFSIKRKACFGQGHSVVHIQQVNLEKLPVIYPNSDTEQQKITDILLKWDKVIQLQEKLIEKLELQKKALMQRLLKPKKDWKSWALREVIHEEIIKTEVNNQHQLISSTKQGLYLQSEYFDKQIASQNNTGYKVLKINQIVLSPQNLWLGNINFNDIYEIGIVSPSYKIFKIKKNFNPVIVAELMKTPKMLYNYTLASEQGASIVRRNLNMDLFYEITICLPDRKVQDIIANQIAVLIKKYLLEIKKYEFLKQQQKAMQHLLLTGIIRV